MDPALQSILQGFGMTDGSRIGSSQGEVLRHTQTGAPDLWLDIPAYIADTLRSIAGDPARVVNATDLFMDPGDGQRATNSADQIAQFEAISTYCSQSVRNEVTQLRPGMTELQAIQLMGLNGLAHSCHTMIGSGPRPVRPDRPRTGNSRWAIRSPPAWAFRVRSPRAPGSSFTTRPSSPAPQTTSRLSWRRISRPWSRGGRAWPSARTGDIAEMVISYMGQKGIGPALNPGHLLHLDEWVHSPFYPGSPHVLRSGMMLQSDIIPTPAAPYGPSNVEDGLALAGEALRAELAAKHGRLVTHRGPAAVRAGGAGNHLASRGAAPVQLAVHPPALPA